MRNFVLCRLSLVLVILMPVLALADMQSSVTPISGLGGALTSGTGLNDQGQVVGNSALPDGSTHAFLFDGQIHDLGTFGGVNSFAYGINNAGDMAIVSAVKNPDNNQAVWPWSSRWRYHFCSVDAPRYLRTVQLLVI